MWNEIVREPNAFIKRTNASKENYLRELSEIKSHERNIRGGKRLTRFVDVAIQLRN